MHKVTTIRNPDGFDNRDPEFFTYNGDTFDRFMAMKLQKVWLKRGNNIRDCAILGINKKRHSFGAASNPLGQLFCRFERYVAGRLREKIKRNPIRARIERCIERFRRLQPTNFNR